jgi:hypothetical protein
MNYRTPTAPMHTPFWRCAIISLLLGALAAQWAAAAVVPCADHPMGMVHKVSEVAAVGATVTSHHGASDGASGSGALVPTHHSHDDGGHAHGLLTDVNTASKAAPHAVFHGDVGDDGGQPHSQTSSASAGHCCLSAALVSTPTLPDFAQRSVSADFAPLVQHHRAPVLSGPERPPRIHTA